MSSYFRKPNQIINPYEFGETECKNTCLWLKGLPNLVPTKIIPKEQRTCNIWKAKFNGKQYSWNDKEVAKLRSKTFKGIAEDTAGFTGAELANILNEAAIIATKNYNLNIAELRKKQMI